MGALISSAFRAAGSLFTPGMPGVFLWSLLATLAALAGFVAGASLFFGWLGGALQNYAFSDSIPWLGGIGSAVLAWMLFPGITPLVISFFDARITRLIEAHAYPGTPPPQPAAFLPELLHDLRFALTALGLNILVLPLYLLPGLNLFLFYWLNGYLLGREYFVMAARRHMPVAEANALRRRHAGVVTAGGALLTFLATVPVLNLLAPFWGVALMVHLYHLTADAPGARNLPHGQRP